MCHLISELMLLLAVTCVPKYINSLKLQRVLFLVENIYLVLEIFICNPLSSAALTILPAYPRICRALLYIVPVVCMLATRIIISKQMLNKSHDRPSPCLNPLVVMNGSDFSPSTLTSDLVSAKVSKHILTSFAGIPNAYIAVRSLSLLMLSYACLKSIKRWCVSIMNSCVFSRNCLKPHW